MYPISAILYSTTTGNSFDMLSVTVFDKVVAFVKELRYRKANVKDTGSFMSITVESSCEHNYSSKLSPPLTNSKGTQRLAEGKAQI
jgi:hypothetical protein